MNIIPSNQIEFTKTSDLDVGKNGSSNVPSLMDKESNLEAGAIITDYVLNTSESEKIPEQESEKSGKSSMFKEMNESNRHESKVVIDSIDPTIFSNPEKASEQELANPIVNAKVLSLPVLIEAIDSHNEFAIRKLDTRSLRDDTYMIPKEEPGN